MQLAEKSDALERAMRALEQMRERAWSARRRAKAGRRPGRGGGGGKRRRTGRARERRAVGRRTRAWWLGRTPSRRARAALADEAMADAEAVGAELRRERERV